MTLANRINEETFSTEQELYALCQRVGDAGLRSTGSTRHAATIDWIEQELAALPGITTTSTQFNLHGWEPRTDGDLVSAAHLTVTPSTPTTATAEQRILVGGAIPLSQPTSGFGVTGELVYIPLSQAITPENAAGKIVLRDFPPPSVPSGALLSNAFHTSADLELPPGTIYDSGAFTESLVFDLMAAGVAGAAALVVAFEQPREQVAGYFEPHSGTHYAVPGIYIGVDEREELRRLAEDGATARVSVAADTGPVETRNLFATLPGQSPERIVLVTHTDGNTWVQDNGIAAMIALARYFSALPVEERARTIEFVFSSAHLHMSREGSAQYAAHLDTEYDEGSIAFVFPIEHLGTRELASHPRPGGLPGTELRFTGRGEPLLWAVGPSTVLRETVTTAARERGLERVILTGGIGQPDEERVPAIVSFGGLGTLYHQHLIPTTSVITGPWSLWAPSFGPDALDMHRLRQQVLAIGDVVRALDTVTRKEIAGSYAEHRGRRAAGARTYVEPRPPEHASTVTANVEKLPYS